MAIDVDLQIDGIKGESEGDKHKDWIEVTGLHWGIHQPRSATVSTGGGHTAERVEMSDVSFSKLVDLSSPILPDPGADLRHREDDSQGQARVLPGGRQR